MKYNLFAVKIPIILKPYHHFISILTVLFCMVSCNPKVMPEKEWAGTKWQLVTINGNTITASPNTQTPSLEFDTNKKIISGNGGCNSYGLSYELKGQNLSFTNIIHTEMACDALDTEVLFFQKLSEVKTFASKQDILQLMDAANKVVLEMRAGKM